MRITTEEQPPENGGGGGNGQYVVLIMVCMSKKNKVWWGESKRRVFGRAKWNYPTKLGRRFTGNRFSHASEEEDHQNGMLMIMM